MDKALRDRVYNWKKRGWGGVLKRGFLAVVRLAIAVAVAIAATARPAMHPLLHLIMQPVPPLGSLSFQQGLAGV